ncbi:zinc knuckle [Ostertagia ostertagi]
MTTLDKVIKQEEAIEQSMPKSRENPPDTKETPKRIAGVRKRRTTFCFYCDSQEHWSTECTKIANPKARLEYLKKANRCIGCGGKNHVFAECKGKGCMKCGKKHHTSTCFQTKQTTEGTPLPKPSNNKKEGSKKTPRAQQNCAFYEDDTLTEDEAPNLTVMKIENTTKGTLHTVHPRTRRPLRLHVLLDTGADRTFIDADLAKELELPEHNVITMKLCTFGEKHPKEIQCIDTYLQVWDSTGKEHNLRVFTHDGLTRNYHRRRLEEKDLQFIRDNHLILSAPKEGEAHSPKILIGCDQLWNFMNFEERNFILPSGLVLVPTRLGYMVTGKRNCNKEDDPGQQSYSVHTVESSYQTLGQWEHHWTIQPHQAEKEFCGPEKEEKALINAQVLADFNK